MEQGDMFLVFMDSADGIRPCIFAACMSNEHLLYVPLCAAAKKSSLCPGELRKIYADVGRERLASLLELAQRTSQANHDPFKDDLRCAPLVTLHYLLKGICFYSLILYTKMEGLKIAL
jgi:hypothetical protein